MTAMGKMLVFLVLILSLIWNGLVMNAYVTRTNWRAEAKKYQEKAQEAAEAANKQKQLLEAEREAAEDAKRALRAEIDRIYSLKGLLESERTDLIKRFNDEFSEDQKKAIEIAKLQANIQRLQAQVNDLDKALFGKEKELDTALIERDAAKVIATKETLDAIAQRNRGDRLQLLVQERTEQIQDLNRKLGAGGAGNNPGLRTPPVPEQLRGTVSRREVSGGDVHVTLTVGLDHGVQKGAIVKVSRTQPNAKYLGTIVILSSDPKESVGRFVPPKGVNRLAAEDYPTRGDEVTPN